jgi:hypothetical protein
MIHNVATVKLRLHDLEVQVLVFIEARHVLLLKWDFVEIGSLVFLLTVVGGSGAALLGLGLVLT